ncbi:MAG TPA: hypothetical protein VFY23_05470 [Candidatus Limnocylindrales bacterium]|nr:hypothetical protein [Candidatus Limnocylindrales bacterium]
MSQARWEWRTFGPGVAIGGPVMARLTPTGEIDSDEVYLLSGKPLTVKIRGGLMDVKERLAVNADGLQQWWPVSKDPIPLDAAAARALCARLGVDASRVQRDSYTADEIVAELADPEAGVRAVGVHKHRVRYDVIGCSAELTDVVADGRATRTLAVEHEDPALVARAVRELGLTGFVNLDYPTGLALLLDDVPERYAVIDTGTNSIKFHVAERRSDGAFAPVLDRAEVTRLGEGIHETGEIAEGAASRAVEAIGAMVREATERRVIGLVAVGTAGLRAARNGDAVVERIAREAGIRIQVISGADEARLAYLAAVDALRLPSARLAVFDTGGGSTQLTFGDGTSIADQFSVEVGAVRYTERFGLDRPVSPDQLAAALAAIREALSSLEDREPIDRLVGMGGAVTNIAAVSHGLATYDPEVIQGSVLTRAELARQTELYRTRTADERRAIPGLQPKRAEVILAGACVVASIMDALGVDQLTVSDRGLRHGVLAAWFGTPRTPLEVPS